MRKIVHWMASAACLLSIGFAFAALLLNVSEYAWTACGAVLLSCLVALITQPNDRGIKTIRADKLSQLRGAKW